MKVSLCNWPGKVKLCRKKSYSHKKGISEQEKSLSSCQWEMINFIKRYSCPCISQVWRDFFAVGRSERKQKKGLISSAYIKTSSRARLLECHKEDLLW